MHIILVSSRITQTRVSFLFYFPNPQKSFSIFFSIVLDKSTLPPSLFFFEEDSLSPHIIIIMSPPCIAFCLLSGTVAFIFSWMMSSTQLTTFLLPAIEHRWDLQQKAAACRNAGFMYLLIALVLGARAYMGPFRPSSEGSRPARVASYHDGGDEDENSDKESAPLIQPALAKQRRALDSDRDTLYGSAREMKPIAARRE